MFTPKMWRPQNFKEGEHFLEHVHRNDKIKLHPFYLKGKEIFNKRHPELVKEVEKVNQYYNRYQLYKTTDSGQSIFYEVIWFMCLIPVLLLFNNKYILHEKHMSLKNTLKIIWIQTKISI